MEKLYKLIIVIMSKKMTQEQNSVRRPRHMKKVEDDFPIHFSFVSRGEKKARIKLRNHKAAEKEPC